MQIEMLRARLGLISLPNSCLLRIILNTSANMTCNVIMFIYKMRKTVHTHTYTHIWALFRDIRPGKLMRVIFIPGFLWVHVETKHFHFTQLFLSLKTEVHVWYSPRSQVRGSTSWERGHLIDRWVDKITWSGGGMAPTS